jgi:transcriptional regulator with XRE-family HTH domain
MSFRRLHGLLIQLLNQALQAGEITERGLARRIGISQPHIHNVLKGKRLLSWKSADALLQGLNLSILDLVNHSHTTDEAPGQAMLEKDEDHAYRRERR